MTWTLCNEGSFGIGILVIYLFTLMYTLYSSWNGSVRLLRCCLWFPSKSFQAYSLVLFVTLLVWFTFWQLKDKFTNLIYSTAQYWRYSVKSDGRVERASWLHFWSSDTERVYISFKLNWMHQIKSCKSGSFKSSISIIFTFQSQSAIFYDTIYDFLRKHRDSGWDVDVWG